MPVTRDCAFLWPSGSLRTGSDQIHGKAKRSVHGMRIGYRRRVDSFWRSKQQTTRILVAPETKGLKNVLTEMLLHLTRGKGVQRLPLHPLHLADCDECLQPNAHLLPQQLKLFHFENPLSVWLGSAFFRALRLCLGSISFTTRRVTCHTSASRWISKSALPAIGM